MVTFFGKAAIRETLNDVGPVRTYRKYRFVYRTQHAIKQLIETQFQ